MPISPSSPSLRDDLVGEGLRAVELLGHRRDLALGELPHGAADQLVLGGEVEVHAGIIAALPYLRALRAVWALLARGQPVTAIGVLRWITAPSWATNSVGMTSLLLQRFPCAASAE